MVTRIVRRPSAFVVHQLARRATVGVMRRCQTPGKQRRSLASAVLVTLLATVCCGVLEPQSCTAIGCLDMATIQLHSSDGSPRTYDISLNVDGREVTCATPAQPGPGSVSTRPCSDPEVSISHEALVDCTETRSGDAVSQSCVPNGKFSQTLEFRSTPVRVGVEMVDAAGATFEHNFNLQYVTSAPNGPGCGPVCEQANAEWVVE